MVWALSLLAAASIGRRIVGKSEYLDGYQKHLSQDKDKYQKYRYSRNDWTTVTGVEVSLNASDQIAALCIQSANINPYPAVAHMATMDITFGLARMWEIHFSETEWEIMVFRERDAAEAWVK